MFPEVCGAAFVAVIRPHVRARNFQSHGRRRCVALPSAGERDLTPDSRTSRYSPLGAGTISASAPSSPSSAVGTRSDSIRAPRLCGCMVSWSGAACARIVYVGQFEAGGVQRFCKRPVESVVGGWGTQRFCTRPIVFVGGSLRWAACARKRHVRGSKASEADKSAAQGDQICSRQQNMSHILQGLSSSGSESASAGGEDEAVRGQSSRGHGRRPLQRPPVRSILFMYAIRHQDSRQRQCSLTRLPPPAHAHHFSFQTLQPPP